MSGCHDFHRSVFVVTSEARRDVHRARDLTSGVISHQVPLFPVRGHEHLGDDQLPWRTAGHMKSAGMSSKFPTMYAWAWNMFSVTRRPALEMHLRSGASRLSRV